MDENIDINKELKEKNQEMLLNKKRIDLDTSMESFMVFYHAHSANMANEINKKVCSIRNIDPNSEQGKVFHSITNNFFSLTLNKLKEIINGVTEPFKGLLNNISDDDYSYTLNQISEVIIQRMINYYSDAINMLKNELNQDTDVLSKDKINEYLSNIAFKIMDTLKNNFMFSIRIIGNNNEENKEVIESINEKTIK